MTPDLYPTRIEGTVTLSDGSETSFSIIPDLGWQQWGNVTDKLAVTGVLMDDLAAATADHLHDPDNQPTGDSQ